MMINKQYYINDTTSYMAAYHDMMREVDRQEDADMSHDFKLKFTKTRDVKDPVRAHRTDAGIDFFYPNDAESISIGSGEDILIDSGIKVIVPEGYALIFKEKSGVATKKKLTLGASVVDSDYRGNVHFHFFNEGKEAQTILPGEKVIQGVVVPVSLCETEFISEEDYNKYETSRGEGGFGSTGVQ